MAMLVRAKADFSCHVARALLARGETFVGIENLIDYCDPALKRTRLAQFYGQAGCNFVPVDFADVAALTSALSVT
jgi:UDP-glucuronate 4-epimerase